MNEIIQNLEADATNGEENFCYISENKLNALKELSKRECEELKKKQDVIDKIKNILKGQYDDREFSYEEVEYHIRDILKEVE